MDLNQKMLSDLASQLGLRENEQEAIKTAIDMSGDYRNESEEVLLNEILKLKKTMKTDSEQYKKQIAVLKTLRNVMNDEQQKRLDMMISLLEN
jgi:hypothetical protein